MALLFAIIIKIKKNHCRAAYDYANEAAAACRAPINAAMRKMPENASACYAVMRFNLSVVSYVMKWQLSKSHKAKKAYIKLA